MKKSKQAFSLVELIIVVMFLGIFAAVAVPRFNFSAITKQKASPVAQKITTDLRRARSMAISDAADNTSGYALNMLGASPFASYEIENLNTTTTVDTLTIDSAISCTGGSLFQFGPLGNLLGGSDTTLTVAGQGRSYTITVISATGTVKCVEN